MDSIFAFQTEAQYLQWIMGHAIAEWQLAAKPMWKRWVWFHKYHKHTMPIMMIHYGHHHIGIPEGQAYFFI